MPQPRNALLSVDTTPSYHVVSRCMRRTFLFGVIDNKDFSHRRDGIIEPLSELTNKTHLVECAFLCFGCKVLHAV